MAPSLLAARVAWLAQHGRLANLRTPALETDMRRIETWIARWRGLAPALLTAAVLAFALSGAVAAGPAHASGPQVKTSPPGWYRMMLGDFEITALWDGTVDLQMEQLLNAPVAKIRSALARQYLKDPVETSVNAFLVNTGSKLVMIDAGTGNLFGPTLGKLVANLKASGYQPEQVDEIYITHMHPDHIGSLVADNKIVFPNAVVRAHQREADYWLSEKNRDAAAKDAKDFFSAAMAIVALYRAAGKFQPFSGDTELVPGVKAMATPGHTPGHTVYVVESKDQKLVLWGDLMHVAAVQFPDPSVTIKFDVDTKAAMPQRRKAFSAAAKEGHFVGVAHLPFPGIGKLRADGKGYDWIPANYSVLR
jgi:glyoxylase-like metal-dependent hydrolase (beta-lactamase superfamily II)